MVFSVGGHDNRSVYISGSQTFSVYGTQTIYNFFCAHLIDLKQKTSLNELKLVSYKFLLLVFFLAENVYSRSYKDENENIV